MKKRSLGSLVGVCLAGVALAASVRAAAPAGNTPAPPPPPLPAIRSLKLEPASLQIQNAYDERRVLVLGVTENKQVIDLTAQATFKPADARVEVDAQGYLHPKEKGASEIVVSAAGREA